MTRVSFQDSELRVTFPGWERWMVGRATFTVPVGEITSVREQPNWTSEILGLRSGFSVSGYRKLGVYTHLTGTKRLVSMTQGTPLLRVGLDRGATGFDELLVSTDDAASIADALRATLPR